MIDEREFREWYGEVLGFGYGTGDVYYCRALCQFFDGCRGLGPYDYNDMEQRMGGAVFWFLLNALCLDDAVEYGASPRFGWLTDRGVRIGSFVNRHDAGQLYNVVMTAD